MTAFGQSVFSLASAGTAERVSAARVDILSVCVLLAVSGSIAAMIPARRAASIDPLQALRAE